MALTGKTIGQLTYLQYPTNDTLIPVELSGDTFHIAFSGVNYTETTYTDLVAGATAGELTTGQYYLMTDYQTCYDRPNFDNAGTPITTGNYASGSTEPLLLLATSTTGFSPTVYSTLYPEDKITYDINFNQTEVTNSPAKGRITERIDSRNNRTDYDFRGVEFIRYDGFSCEDIRPGTITIDGSGNVSGTNTQFDTDFIVGNYIGVYDTNAFFAGFMFYEITTIDTPTSMTISGVSINSISNATYGYASTLSNEFPYQSNVGSYNSSVLYSTFNNSSNYNNYLGDNIDYNTFILSNNVFLNGAYENNYFGGNVANNTLDDDMDSNTIGPYFQFNVINDDFDRNTIGSYCQRNIIVGNFWYNQIGYGFRDNMLGDDDGQDFSSNVITNNFYKNFFTFSNNDFRNNNIGNSFFENIIDSGMVNNNIKGNFNSNRLLNDNFNNNNIGYSFTSNVIPVDFVNNTVGENFYSNNIYSQFEYNTTGSGFGANTLGDPNSISTYLFSYNNIGTNCETNYFSGYTQFNTIGSFCQYNNVDTNFSYNQIGSTFQYNTVANDFGFGGGEARGNIVGNWFNHNTVGEYCYNNTFGDNINYNTLSNNFWNNKISFGMNNITINNVDSGNGFKNNTISYEYFSTNLLYSGGTGGNPVFYTNIPTNVTFDYADASGYVTFLSGGTIIAQNLLV